MIDPETIAIATCAATTILTFYLCAFGRHPLQPYREDSDDDYDDDTASAQEMLDMLD